jgi:hypothetical protein
MSTIFETASAEDQVILSNIPVEQPAAEEVAVTQEVFEEDFSDDVEAVSSIDPLEGVTLIFGTEEVVVAADNTELHSILSSAADSLGINDVSRIRFRHSGQYVDSTTIPQAGEVYNLLVTGNSKA